MYLSEAHNAGESNHPPRLRDRRAAPMARPAARSVVGLQLIRVSDASSPPCMFVAIVITIIRPAGTCVVGGVSSSG
ncbi:MAG: hypothetical protein NC117_08830 [Pseudoflavonifractor sp.]|nr:hypothetical protein [Pseudoflavonifractor sp.]